MIKLKYKGLRTYRGVPSGIGALQRFYGISRYQYRLYLEGGLKGVFSEDKSKRIEQAIKNENAREDSLKDLAQEAFDRNCEIDSAFLKKVEKIAMMPLKLNQLLEFLKLEIDE